MVFLAVGLSTWGRLLQDGRLGVPNGGLLRPIMVCGLDQPLRDRTP